MDFFSLFALQEIMNSVNRYFDQISASVVPIVIERQIEKENVSGIRINDKEFPLWHSKTEKNMQKGLSGIDYMSGTQGMIFIYQKADNHYFWMNRMLIPLDFVWINNDIIVDIFSKNNKNLNAFTSDKKADKIIEFNKGTCDKYDINIGDRIEIIYD